MKKAILYFVAFAAIQMLAGAIVMFVHQMIKGPGADSLGATELILTTALMDVVTLVCFLCLKWAELSPNWLRTRPWGVFFWCALAAFGAILPSMFIQEMMPELPNLAEHEFELIMTSPFGYIIIGLMAPLVEEIVFRGAILKSLLKNSSLPVWGSIALSAFLFALIHMNPAQMPHAFVIGLLLGWMYQRTGSILPGMAYHWANNSAAYALYNIYPNPDIKLIDILGDVTHVWLAVGFSLLILLPALFQLHIRMKQA
jgi:membrane protease YdiL (CAAX protease family)